MSALSTFDYLGGNRDSVMRVCAGAEKIGVVWGGPQHKARLGDSGQLSGRVQLQSSGEQSLPHLRLTEAVSNLSRLLSCSGKYGFI